LFFSKAPDGCVAACNSTKNYIWGGNESKCSGFIIIDANNPDTLYDYTDVINNTLTDAQNVATMATVGGGIDADTTVLLSFNNNLDDSSIAADHDFTAGGSGNSYSTAIKKFGTHSLYMNGSGNALCADHADYDCTGGIWSMDIWAYSTSLAGNRGLWSLYTDANNYAAVSVNTAGAVMLSVFAASSEVVNVTTANSVFKANTWHHVEVTENGDDYRIFVDGVQQGYTVDTSRLANYTGNQYVGNSVLATWVGYVDEFRLSVGVARHIAGFTTMTSPYSASSLCTLLVASQRPLKGIKPYIGTANATAATVTGTYWNGAETALAAVVDGSASGGASLAVTGSITFTDTASDAKVQIKNNQQYYWYKFTFSGIDATTTIYHCTLDAGMQTIKDIWDGQYRTCLSMMTYTTSYSDYTLQVYQNDYYATDTSTYVNISDMTNAQYLLAGFSERTMAIYIGLAEAYANTTASTVATVYYRNGSAWVSVGAVDDGTSQGGISLSKSGIISWDAPSANGEFTWTPNNGVPLYYYKIVFSNTIDNTDSKIYLNYVAGIPAQTILSNYKFPLFWQNRLLLCGDQSGRKNMVIPSAGDTNCVFNGTDSNPFPVDGDDELMAGATLFTRFGGDVYDSAILCKRGQTFLLDNDPSNASMFLVRTVSTNKGCVAPYTMKLCDIGFDIASNIRKHILIWLSDSGLMVFDGVSMGTISDYFQNVFDPLDDDYINRTYIDDAYGEYDPVEQEYILSVPIGATPTWKEIHYKLKQQAPFYVERGTGKALRCAFIVEDAEGNKYVYGGTNDGFIERLEYGTTMDGNGIVYTMHLSDFNLTKTGLRRSRIHAIQLVGKMKSTTAQVIAATHYTDGIVVGDALTPSPTISQNVTGYRIFRRFFPVNGDTPDGVFHSTKFVITTDDENRGFEPLLVSYIWSDEGEVFS
jgi:hypothetical protein